MRGPRELHSTCDAASSPEVNSLRGGAGHIALFRFYPFDLPLPNGVGGLTYIAFRGNFFLTPTAQFDTMRA
jgi:hypothetical protein